MKHKLALVLALIGWITLVIRLKMRIETEDVVIAESIIRFFSYFTILTNLLVTVYFTYIGFNKKWKGLNFFDKPGSLTALAAFMTFVGIIYHISLRPVWNPTGITMVLSEIHHSIIPIGIILFWYLYENKRDFGFKKLLVWLLYPVIYIVYVLIRGQLSQFYPYYFLDVSNIGFSQVCINSILLLLTLTFFLSVFYFIGKKLKVKTM